MEPLKARTEILSSLRIMIVANIEKNDKLAKRFTYGITISIPAAVVLLISMVVLQFIVRMG